MSCEKNIIPILQTNAIKKLTLILSVILSVSKMSSVIFSNNLYPLIDILIL